MSAICQALFLAPNLSLHVISTTTFWGRYSCPIYRWGHWSTGKLSNLSKFTHEEHNRPGSLSRYVVPSGTFETCVSDPFTFWSSPRLPTTSPDTAFTLGRMWGGWSSCNSSLLVSPPTLLPLSSFTELLKGRAVRDSGTCWPCLVRVGMVCHSLNAFVLSIFRGPGAVHIQGGLIWCEKWLPGNLTIHD